MTILAKLATAKMAAATMAVNFWPWLLGAGLVGASISSYATFQVTRAFYQRDALQARLDLSNFRSELATATADGKTRALRDLEQAHANMAAWGLRIEQRIDRNFGVLQAGLAADNEKLRGLISDPIYDCLRTVPLPADYLRLLSRPGGAVPAGNREDPGATAAASGVPAASGGGAVR